MQENIRLAFQGVWSHKMRSVLTMLGIIIGIAAIITIVSTIQGTNEQIKENLIGAGNNVVTVQLNRDGYPYDLSWNPIPDGVKVITQETREELEAISGVEKVSLYQERPYAEYVYYRNTQFNGAISGIDENYMGVYGLQVKSGRGFTEEDYQKARKVLLVDTATVKGTFDGVDPVGKIIEIQGDAYTVVGVVDLSKDFAPTINSYRDYMLYMGSSSGKLYMPNTTWPTSYRFDEPQSVAIKVKSTDDMASVGQDAAKLLTERQVTNTAAKLDYRSQDLLEQAENLQKMAIGAKKRRILLQFLTESAVLTSLGGIIGVISGIIMAQLISSMMAIPVSISPPAIVVAVVFSTLIGVVFGMLPAVQAANLNPIEALRRD